MSRQAKEPGSLSRSTAVKVPSCLSGVYQIRCLPNGKIYVGSAVDLRARWHQHRLSLRRGNHRNRHLQKAWNKYGEANFEFSILELTGRSNLLSAEQSWIDQTGCADRKTGFNLYAVAGSPGDTNARIWKGFVDPDGNEITIFNLHQFCRQHGLNFSAMRSLALGKGKLKSHRGWTNKKSIRQRDYVKTYEGFIAPDGCRIGPVTNLAAFCREHGLDNTHMLAVMRGRICSHRGWTHENGRQQKKKTYTGFISPDGQRVMITNLQAFCREHGLHPVHMHQVRNGQRKSHKGWTWREDVE
ncbi:MAG TPA: GIY-YIG nuclease family protein [Blastocatellia bacterium]|nr:GIY-YIG nuclease family protein [Blastocatellia bacterium]